MQNLLYVKQVLEPPCCPNSTPHSHSLPVWVHISQNLLRCLQFVLSGPITSSLSLSPGNLQFPNFPEATVL